MADEVKEPVAEVEKTPEEVADDRLTELVGQMNAVEDEPEEPETEDPTDLEEPEPEPAPAAKAKATEEWKPSSLVRYARQLGVSEAKIASLPTEALDILCDGLAEQREAEIANKAKEPEAVEEDEDDVLLRELQEELDPKVFKLLEKSVKKTKAIEAERAVEKKNAEQKRVDGMIADVDAAFADLDSPLLGGKAEGRTLDQATDEMERRNMIVRKALENPLPGKSLREAVKHYSRKILGITASETPATDDPIEKRKAQYRASATSRPTKRTEIEEPGDEAAMKAVGKWMKEVGYGDD